MDRPTSKATKADWIAYADAIEAERDVLQGDADELRRELDGIADGSLVEQLRRRLHELQRRAG